MSSSPDGVPVPGKWDIYGFTTTPEERIGTGLPYSTPSLEVNLFFRVFLGVIALFITWVPARVLFRSGEFAGTTFCVITMVLNFVTVTNALIWRDDNVETWFSGYGWCDIQTYIMQPLHTAFNIALFEIMRSLASKVAINRASALTSQEKRRERIISGAVIFAIPILQVILTFFVAVGRYNVSTLVGCGVYYFPNWFFLVFFVLPSPMFSISAAVMAVITFIRYRKIEAFARNILSSNDSIAAARQARVRKKLYFMTLTIIIVVLPLVLTLLARNLKVGLPWTAPYDYDFFHFGADPFNIYFVSFTTSDKMTFQALVINYIAELAGIMIFIPFGTTVDALNSYRKCLLFVGLGYVFPKLRQAITSTNSSSSRRNSRVSWWRSLVRPLSSTSTRFKSSLLSSSSSRKGSLLPTVEHNSPARSQPNPWPELSMEEMDSYTHQGTAGSVNQGTAPFSNPFAFATVLCPSRDKAIPISLPKVSFSALKSGTQVSATPTSGTSRALTDNNSANPWDDVPLGPMSSSSQPSPSIGVDTRVWSGDDKKRDNDTEAITDDLEAQSQCSSPTKGKRGIVRVETRIARKTEETTATSTAAAPQTMS
ncbi:pheromone A receptor-domain-containing protein [Podospora australis]|uniref:Pheromone A receptor-domain-containing protein n=1 Tax=Podospora australis TaxID=1536484 RepID=A0AAN6WS69_9PEZI|nr:pheromone A receptor-domain-containing protein [Podospora australis]